MRWLEDDGHVSVFRTPTNNGNGNTFDFQGRQITCEHLTRRVVRYELDGSVTVIADNYNGKHTSSAPARAPGTPVPAARATSPSLTSAPTTSSRIRNCSPIAWSTA